MSFVRFESIKFKFDRAPLARAEYADSSIEQLY